jgi:hypothetical protein
VKNFVQQSDGGVDYLDWDPHSLFPAVEDDALLFLAFLGGRYHSAFQSESGIVVPYGFFLLRSLKETTRSSFGVDYGNSAQSTNDGMFLEAVLASVVCLASHSMGIGGAAFAPFMKSLVYHLQVREDTEATAVQIENIDLFTGMSQFTVPFLTPPNTNWPEFVTKLPGGNFGNLKRTKNSDGVDLGCYSVADKKLGIYGESKDYSKNLDGATVAGILQKIPMETKLHLVLVKRLQASYFRKATIPDAFVKSHAKDMSVFKLDAQNARTSLEPFHDLLPHDYAAKRVVIFISAHKDLEE